MNEVIEENLPETISGNILALTKPLKLGESYVFGPKNNGRSYLTNVINRYKEKGKLDTGFNFEITKVIVVDVNPPHDTLSDVFKITRVS